MTSKLLNKEQVEGLQNELGIVFKEHNILINALIHRSFINEVKGQFEHNERLEFLGDAVLELIVTEHLYEKYPDRPEGDLTSFRAALVRTESLAETSKKLNLGKYILMSKGEESTGGRERPYILANTFEALLGAIYLDNGMETARNFVANNLFGKLEGIVKDRLDIDNKSKLQEISQEVLKVTPTYESIKEEGPDHEKIFTLAVLIESHKFGEGKGQSKQEAAQNAAKDALKNWVELAKKYYNIG